MESDTDNEQVPFVPGPLNDEDASRSKQSHGQRPAHAHCIALDSSSSDSDAPLLARRSGSIPSQRHSSDHDSDFASDPSSPARGPQGSGKGLAEAPLRSVNDLHKRSGKATGRKRCHSSTKKQRQHSQQSDAVIQGGTAGSSERQKRHASTEKDGVPAASAAAVNTSVQQPHNEAENTVGGRGIANAASLPAQHSLRVAEEPVPAFEIPSQMPKELQTWAWDK